MIYIKNFQYGGIKMKEFIAITLGIFLLLAGCGTTSNDLVTDEAKPVSEKGKVEKSEEAENMEQKEDSNTESRNTKNSVEINAEKKSQSAPVTGEKEKYIKQLNDIKKGLSEFDKALETGTQFEIGQAYGEIFTRWDNALNDIYGALEKQLSASEMDRLREEQRKWITYRDETAKKASLKFEGGTMESLEYISTQARLTEERCYELVERYMKQ
ncbi:lysozyme inhibitor LprI family protein [Robertmurraya kyonggiensis]|uniref:DUF1311 domain-containing protein n=1 Tax=Robertmurraya kyonggiensis TaxID=1037680 RepID=A0A4U1D3H0_9BACI|nr:lysozyme inhibitor LprI family protein [Robertmurraya kyonggiensis]TKC16724.1 DUF1311 domain-containing protein [Robertmurraya kyonggiensis]